MEPGISWHARQLDGSSCQSQSIYAPNVYATLWSNLLYIEIDL